MLYYLLFLILLIIFLYAYQEEGRELFSPAPLALISFMVADVLAIVGMNSWNDVELKWEVFLVIILGVISLLIGVVAATRVFVPMVLQRLSRIGEKEKISIQFDPPIWRYAVVVLLVLLGLFLLISETIQIAKGLGIESGSFPEIAKAVRNETATYNNASNITFDEGFSILERQLSKIVTVVGYVSMFMFVRELMRKRERMISIKLVAPAILLILSVSFSLASGSRSNVFYYGFAGVVIWAILRMNQGKNNERNKIKLIVGGLIVASVAVLAFYFSSVLVGRKAGDNILEYISFYFGAGIPSFQHIVNTGVETTAIVGSRTFYNLFAFLTKFGLINDLGSSSIAWISLNGLGSNIFTAFARYYLDFGYVGVVLLSLISGLIFGFAYRMARCMESEIWIILYAYFSVYVINLVREDFICSAFLSPAQVIIILLLIVTTIFLIRPIQVSFSNWLFHSKNR